MVSVGAATVEGPIDMDNIPAIGLPLMKWRDQGSCVQSLLLQEVARRAPDVSFVHTAPGVVKSGIMRDAEGFRIGLIIAIARLMAPFVQTPPDECAERHVFIATSAAFASGQNNAAAAGVPAAKTLTLPRGADGQTGSGMYSINHRGETASREIEKLLATYKEDGTAKKVWDYVAEDFKRITGTEVAL